MENSKDFKALEVPAHIAFLRELLRRHGISDRRLTLIEGVRLLGADATTEGGAKEWLRDRWREMARRASEVETLKRIRMGRSVAGRVALKHWRNK